MEAMSIGIPVISTKISGIPELIDDNMNGFLVEPDDPTALSNKIEEVLSISENQLNEIVKNARSRIENDFNIKSLTKELINIFKSVECSTS